MGLRLLVLWKPKKKIASERGLNVKQKVLIND
jgi:hypothetical protein